MEKVLREQAASGQFLVLPEKVAREMFGDRLTVAPLGAIAKPTDDDGNVIGVRAIHDGTHGVDVNRFIKVLNGALFLLEAGLSGA